MSPADPGPEAPAATRRAFLKQLAGGVLAVAGAGAARASPLPAKARALFVVFSDTHSAHDRYPAIVAAVDRLRAENPRVPLAVLFNGDLFERGNVVALRGEGRADLALVRALARRAPVVFNLGNHEGALFDVEETVRLLQAAGATVVSNVTAARDGRAVAAPAAHLELAGVPVAVAGLATDDLSTYRAAVRDSLRIPDGPPYAAEHLGRLLGGAAVRVVLSHEGTLDDRRMLAGTEDGSLVIGGHDHLRYTHRQGRTLYLHTGSWGEALHLVGVMDGPGGIELVHREVPITPDSLVDAELAGIVAAEQRAHLAGEDRAVVGWTRRALPFREAALLAAAAVRDAAGADVGLIGNTTFGTGLPAGPVSRFRFDAFVRFDGELVRARTDGATLRAILRRANQFDETPFAGRTGEYVVASPVGPLDPARGYTVATVDWVRLHAVRYLGTTLDFAPVGGPGLKAVVAARLAA